MAKNKKIAIIGHFGGYEEILDGQTVKTKILYQELTEAAGWQIQKVDTYYKRKNPVKLLWQTAKCLLTVRDVVVLLSGKGMRFYFPLLSFCSKVFHTRVYHDVIGGNLAGYVRKYPAFRKYLNSFAVNWVETRKMQKELTEQGVTNVDVVPNFKRLNCVEETSLRQWTDAPYRFCTFSRVMQEKGIEEAIAAIEQINTAAGKLVCQLDIYGRVDAGYQERFDRIMKTATPAVRYCGMVPYDKSVEAICHYYALLFPTYWRGEGFAGTIVDAFSAGLPVIASDWGSNSEIVENGIEGLLYPSREVQTLTQAVQWAVENPQAMYTMAKNALLAAERYQPDAYIRKMIAVIEGE